MFYLVNTCILFYSEVTLVIDLKVDCLCFE